MFSDKRAVFYSEMYIYNATFIIEPACADEFIGWITPLARKAAGDAPSRLSRICAAGTEENTDTGMTEPDGRGEDAVSVAFQTEFHTMDAAREWSRRRLRPLVAAFERRFAPGMVFTSVFETIEF